MIASAFKTCFVVAIALTAGCNRSRSDESAPVVSQPPPSSTEPVRVFHGTASAEPSPGAPGSPGAQDMAGAGGTLAARSPDVSGVGAHEAGTREGGVHAATSADEARGRPQAQIPAVSADRNAKGKAECGPKQVRMRVQGGKESCETACNDDKDCVGIGTCSGIGEVIATGAVNVGGQNGKYCAAHK